MQIKTALVSESAGYNSRKQNRGSRRPWYVRSGGHMETETGEWNDFNSPLARRVMRALPQALSLHSFLFQLIHF